METMIDEIIFARAKNKQLIIHSKIEIKLRFFPSLAGMIYAMMNYYTKAHIGERLCTDILILYKPLGNLNVTY